MSPAGPIRSLLVAEQCDPDAVSVPLEGWSHTQAVAALPDVAAVVATQIRGKDRILARAADPSRFTFLDSEPLARPLWRAAQVLRGGAGKGWTTVTALSAIPYAYFERLLWRRFGPAIARGEFDVVHRVTPLSPTIGSRIAVGCKRRDVPFVVGPLNGGVPWPPGWDGVRRREREWLSYVRGAYRCFPSHRWTRDSAAALIVGSRATLALEASRYHSKCVYIPENGIDPARFDRPVLRDPPVPMRVAFVGRLVPYKCADVLVEAAAPLLNDGAIILDLIGDGPERPRIEALVRDLGVSHGLEMAGWVAHEQLADRLGRSHVFAFPSVREFGGAVVVEAMALGLVPVVVDYGGPAEIVSPATGVTLPLGPRAEMVLRLRGALERLARAPRQVEEMGRAARTRVLRSFTWDAKARQVLEVYRWVTGARPDKPDFGMPIPDAPLPDRDGSLGGGRQGGLP